MSQQSSEQTNPFEGIEITTKTFLQSSTIKWLLVSVITNLGAIGVNVTPFTTARIDAIVNLFAVVVAVGTGVMAMRARARATEIITAKAVPNQVLGTVRKPTTDPASAVLVPVDDIPPGAGGLANLFLPIVIGILLGAIAVSQMGGCAQYSPGEHVTFRETVWKGLERTGAEHDKWAGVIAGDTNGDGTVDASDGPIDLSKLPNLLVLTSEQRNAWLQSRLLPYREAKAFVEQDRQTVPTNPLAK